MNNAIIMVGLPGSGKSTIRDKFLEQLDEYTFIYSTDDYIEDIASIKNSTYSEVFEDNIKSATEILNQRLIDEVNQETDVLWDQTNTGLKKRKWIISKFPKSYNLQCVCILPPQNSDEEAELFKRLDSREGKVIPNHIIQNMLDTFIFPTVSEGFDKVTVYNIYGELINE
jgi:predicted kinase